MYIAIHLAAIVSRERALYMVTMSTLHSGIGHSQACVDCDVNPVVGVTTRLGCCQLSSHRAQSLCLEARLTQPPSLEPRVNRMIWSEVLWRRLSRLLQAAADLLAWRRHRYCMLRSAHKIGVPSRPGTAFLLLLLLCFVLPGDRLVLSVLDNTLHACLVVNPPQSTWPSIQLPLDMDAAGVGVGVLALAGLFNNAVDSYGYVRLGKCYATDFETSQTKLDLSRLQLSRWGEALGLTAPLAETTQLPSGIGLPDEVKAAEKALGNIVHSLDDAKLLSQRFKNRESEDDVVVIDPEDSKLHRRFHRIVSQRQRNTSFAKKAAWALYRKNDLENLVEHIVGLTNQLVSLFPATESQQRELSSAELGDLGDDDLTFVKRIADDQDPMLATAAQQAMRARGSTYHQPTTRNGAAAHHGDTIHSDYRGPVGGLSHTYHGPLAEGKDTKQHCGNVYRGADRT
jgi:hypothetical protein